jgi:glutaconate CoA-transferase subunit B
MTIVAARSLPDEAVCFVGIGLPSAAANLARRLHAPDLLLIYESGTIGAKPDREATGWPLRVADEVTETAPPTPEELAVLRELKTRTERAHAESRIGG